MIQPCKRCGAARALIGSDHCRGCWQGWWASVCILSQIRVAEAKRSKD